MAAERSFSASDGLRDGGSTMWLAKDAVGNVAPKAGSIDARSRALNNEAINVLLTGGNRLLQESVIQLLDDSRFSVEKCVENLDQAITSLKQDPGDFQMLIFQLVDYNDVHFFERLADVKRTEPDLRIVLLAWPIKELNFLSHSYEIGIDAYLESTTSQEGFRQSLDHVVSGQRIFPSRFKDAPVRIRKRADAEKPPVPSGLSGRELEILRHLASGRANKVIANDLHITEATVKVHVKGILRKIGATNRTQAAIWAIHNGLRPIYV
jgi:two-component system nitrate/nitrite response regulator NarL